MLVVGVLGCVFLGGCLRCSGKRRLSKVNAFDLVVAVSLGSVLAPLLLSKSVALAEGGGGAAAAGGAWRFSCLSDEKSAPRVFAGKLALPRRHR